MPRGTSRHVRRSPGCSSAGGRAALRAGHRLPGIEPQVVCVWARGGHSGAARLQLQRGARDGLPGALHVAQRPAVAVLHHVAHRAPAIVLSVVALRGVGEGKSGAAGVSACRQRRCSGSAPAAGGSPAPWKARPWAERPQPWALRPLETERCLHRGWGAGGMERRPSPSACEVPPSGGSPRRPSRCCCARGAPPGRSSNTRATERHAALSVCVHASQLIAADLAEWNKDDVWTNERSVRQEHDRARGSWRKKPPARLPNRRQRSWETRARRPRLDEGALGGRRGALLYLCSKGGD